MNANSQASQVLKVLKKGRSLTSWQAIVDMRITRLSAVIHTLKQRGHRIKTTIKKTPEGRSYGSYLLTKNGDENAREI